ncbi:hypothetical protein [Bifidobacterium thermophilum]|uniref:Uncharacterized protein n=1 Tax=Bifidobacterium thermophilum TaxID=33905 RepID=A0A7X9NS92_9BIFI|nr:hypothetical protein [Bifidobacterium thermophilum]NME62871.1 hypothetical protein [Bifidobacterium thermophilum]
MDHTDYPLAQTVEHPITGLLGIFPPLGCRDGGAFCETEIFADSRITGGYDILDAFNR